MATSLTTINNNTHQWRQLFSLPFCKCFSTSFLHNSPTFAFPPPKQALISPKLLPHFFSVKHHFSVITVKDPVTLSSFNSNSSTETLDFIKSNDSLSIGFCLDETKNEKKQRSEKEKSGDNGKSRKNGVGSSFEARNEKGTGSFSYRSSNDRKDRRLEGVSGELSRNDDGFGRREFGSENGGRSSGRIDFGRRKEKGSEFSMSRSNSRKERGEMDEIVGDNGKSRNSRKNGIGSTLEARHEKGINDGKDRKLEGIIGGLSKDNDGFRRREFGSESGVRAGGRIDIRKKSEKGSELSMSRSNSGKERGEMEESIGELFDNEKGSYSFSSRSSNDREGTNLEGVIVELSKKNDRFSRREFGSKNGERIDFGKRSEKGSEFSISRLSSRKERGEMEGVVDKVAKSNDGSSGRGLESGSRGQKGVWLSPKRQRDGNLGTIGVNGEVDHGRTIKRDGGNNVSKGKKQRVAKKGKAESPEFKLRVGLDMCSKNGDVMGAISLYDSAVQREVNMGQYHYTVLLYLCSSAAMGIVRPAKSGSGSRSLDKVGPQDWDESDDSEDEDDDTDDKEDEALDVKDQTQKVEVNDIRVSDDVKKYALEKGFEIYERMCLGKVQMNEAALTSVARLAMAMGDGDMAFDMVKQMKSLGIRTRLRSYGPALSVFTGRGELDKAFAVEEHMLENGVYPEEPELEALLRVSVQTGKADRVYYVLHKLRTSVRAVSPSTADLIEKWFMGKEATRIGKRKWDQSMIAQTMQNNGGGWHGQGWLGRGKWTVSQTSIGEDGLCKCCGEKLALIDLDPEETERFAESVASIALKREKNLSFQKFQKWLDYYGPYEAVVDAANVGLFSQRKFKPSKVNAVVNGVRQMLPSRKWPLIVLHNKRVTGSKMEQPVNRALVERWKNADALFATPTGSNDDWYWLYAAIKYKCLLVTNDEMRDHTFQLLGNDFFPKWKERHQVRFSFSEIGPVFHMPPPCSVVIQESDKGHWHIPVASEQQSEADRTWLCITRSNLLVVQQDLKVGANSAEGNPGAKSDMFQR